MRTFLFSSLVTIALTTTSCMQGYTPAESRLSSIPTPVHNKDVEVFFPGERPVDTAYVKIAVLEEKAEGEVAYSKLVDRMKQKAMLQGVDALLLLNKNQSTKLKSDQSFLETLVEIASGEQIEDNYYSVPVHALSGIGIKYKRNLQYLSEYVQSKLIYSLEQGKEELLATVSVNHQNLDTKVEAANQVAEDTYQKYVRNYSLQHLLSEEGPNWYYKMNQAGQVQKRKLKSGDGNGAVKAIKIRYNTYGFPEKLELKSFFSPLPEMITLSYNAKHQVTEKLIYQGEQLFLKETNVYDASGKLMSTLHEKIENGQLIPFLKTEYRYYEMLSLN